MQNLAQWAVAVRSDVRGEVLARAALVHFDNRKFCLVRYAPVLENQTPDNVLRLKRKPVNRNDRPVTGAAHPT